MVAAVSIGIVVIEDGGGEDGDMGEFRRECGGGYDDGGGGKYGVGGIWDL